MTRKAATTATEDFWSAPGEPTIPQITAALVAAEKSRTAANLAKLLKLRKARTRWYGEEVSLLSRVDAVTEFKAFALDPLRRAVEQQLKGKPKHDPSPRPDRVQLSQQLRPAAKSRR